MKQRKKTFRESKMHGVEAISSRQRSGDNVTMLQKAIMGKGASSDSDKNRFELIREISINKFHFRNQMKFLESVKNDLLQI